MFGSRMFRLIAHIFPRPPFLQRRSQLLDQSAIILRDENALIIAWGGENPKKEIMAMMYKMNAFTSVQSAGFFSRECIWHPSFHRCCEVQRKVSIRMANALHKVQIGKTDYTTRSVNSIVGMPQVNSFIAERQLLWKFCRISEGLFNCFLKP